MSREQESLASFIADRVGKAPLRVEESLGNGFVRLRTSEAERRQAKHDIRCAEDIVIELLRNARDAGARTIYLATSREGSMRTITCIDDGSGIPSSMVERIFEARVTSKLDTMCMDRWGVHGRGMALFSIRQNACSALVKATAPSLGTALAVTTDCSVLSERADQSTWPQVDRTADGTLSVVRGPHNIVRTVVEFALDTRREATVYFGSPADILATLVDQGSTELTARGLLHENDPTHLPVRLRPAVASDARSLAECAAKLGLEVSERTCYRILNKEIESLRSVVSCAMPRKEPSTAHVDLAKDRRGLKVSDQDLEDFTKSLRRSFNVLGDRYYLSLKDDPHVRIAGDTVTVTFSIEKEM